MHISRLSALCFAALASSALAGEPRSVTLEVPGMYCSLCNISVRKALERVPGVSEAKADNAVKRAVVTYDPDRITPAELASILTKSGFAATVRAQ